MPVNPSRQTFLFALLVGIIVATAVVLVDVLGTIFFAITVAYVLVPLSNWLRRRGFSQWWASLIATITAFVGLIVIFLPIIVILYRRRDRIIQLLNSIPEEIVIEFGGFVYVINSSDVVVVANQYVTEVAIGVAQSTPAFAAKAFVFAFVVFALTLHRVEIRGAFLDPLPEDYREVTLAIHTRIRGTLFALYIIQALTALGTFLVAVPVFWVLGYSFPLTLGVVAGILQFLPVIGPSVLIVTLALLELSAGAVTQAIMVVVVGLVLIGLLPDVILRPRLARETANLPASLYFIGFTGGVLSLGAIGIIAGPLIVAILSEVFSLFANEMLSSVEPPDQS